MTMWTEPTTLRLRWGGYRARYAAGLAAILLGALLGHFFW